MTTTTAAPGELRLRYRIADFDADDEVVFVVSDAAGDGVRIAPAELDRQGKIWVLAQGERLPSKTDEWAPPVVMPRAAADALRSAGSCTLRTGWAEDRDLVLEQCELDDLGLDDEQVSALKPWKKKLLCARTPEGDALVAADAKVAPLLVLRVDDACSIEWIEGELVGARDKAVAPKAAVADKRGPAEIVLDASAPMPERVKAARKLAKKADAASFEALVRAQMGEVEWKNQHELANAASSAYTAAWNGGVHFALGPLLAEALARATEVPFDPELSFRPPGPLAVAQSLMVHLLNRARSGELADPAAEAAMRGFAKGKYAGATVGALEYFAERGEAEAIDAVAGLLAFDASKAARAMTRLDPAEASRRYREQLAAIEAGGQAHIVSNARSAMFSALQQAAPGWTDGAQRHAWAALWESTADQPWAKDKIASAISFGIELVHAGEKPIAVIAAVHPVTGGSIAEAKALVGSAPRLLKSGLTFAEADALAKQLTEAGATVAWR